MRMNFTGVALLILMALPYAAAQAAAPGAFSLQFPVNRSASESTTTAFSWGFSSGAATYTLEVATDGGFGAANVVNKSGLTTTSYTLPTPLTPGVVYFWRVTAINAGGAIAAANSPLEFSAPIAIGSGNPGSLAVTPDGARVLVARGNSVSGFLADVSVAGHGVTQTIPVGIAPAGVAIRADGQEAVVANSIGHSVSVVNLANNTVKATVPVPCVGTTLYDVAYVPDGTRIVLPDLSSSCTVEGLRLITLATQAQSFVNISGAGQGVAVMPNGDSALNTRGILGTTVRRMNLASSAVVTIANTSSSFGVAVTPDSSQAIVASGEGDTIKRISLATNAVVGATPFGSNQNYHNVAITPDGSKVVIVGDFNTALISLVTDTVVTQYPDGGGNVAISPDGKSAYITASDGSGNVLLKVIRIPGAPRVREDFNGDGKSDVFWRHANGTTLVWQMNGTSVASTGSPATVSDANWKVVGVGDFDGDGKADLLWKNDATGTVFVWLMNGTAIATTGSPATVGPVSSGWVVRAVGDFDGDGKADILWQNTQSGNLFVWLMNGTTIASTGSPATVTDAGWVVQGVGDFDGDGKADVLWKHTNGTVFVWLMNGAAISATGSPATVGDASAGWVVQGVGDFDGDGKADVLWQNTLSGTVFVWKMNGATISTTGSPATVGAASGWVVRGVGDYDGDGKADVLWENTTSGTVFVWLMSGTAISTTGSPATVSDSNWQVQNPN